MLLKVFVFGLLAGAVMSASIDCNIDKCAKPAKLYEELGCKAVFGSRSCCPKRFECPDLNKSDDDKCTFEGKDYQLGEILPRDETVNTKCVETCFCTRHDNEPAKFACTNSDCGVSSFKLPGCINIYGDLNECCSTSIVCEKAEKELLATCIVGGVEYHEGEKFIPRENACHECLCHKDFDNSTIADNPHCRKLNCQIDLRYKSFVQRGCLPVFHNEKCCPVDWECPKHGKKIVKRSASDDETQTKENIYIVTPSKIPDDYLAEVRLLNKDEYSREYPVKDSEEPTATTESKLDHSSPAPLPTLSTNPFLPPGDEITIPYDVKTDEQTTVSLKALAEPEQSTATDSSTKEATVAVTISTTEAQTTTSSEAPSTSKASEIIERITETSALITSQDITTVRTSTTPEKEETETESFKKTLEDEDEYEYKTVAPSSTEALVREVFTTSTSPAPTTEALTTHQETSAAPSTLAETSAASTTRSETTEALKEAVKTLEQPEEITTERVEVTTLDATTAGGESEFKIAPPETSSKAESTSAALVTSELTSVAPTTSAVLVTSEDTDATSASPSSSTTPATSKANTEAPITSAVEDLITTITSTPTSPLIDAPPKDFTLLNHEVLSDTTTPVAVSAESQTSAPTTQSPLHHEVLSDTTTPVAVSTESQTSAPTTQSSDFIFPTEFDKILTTLRDFVAKADSLTSTQATPHLENPLLEQQVEFVNYTVTSEKELDATKSISKRSITDGDYKPHILLNKGCQFNGNYFKLGEVIKTNNDCLKCICEYAPIGHCVLKEKCNF